MRINCIFLGLRKRLGIQISVANHKDTARLTLGTPLNLLQQLLPLKILPQLLTLKLFHQLLPLKLLSELLPLKLFPQLFSSSPTTKQQPLLISSDYVFHLQVTLCHSSQNSFLERLWKFSLCMSEILKRGPQIISHS